MEYSAYFVLVTCCAFSHGFVVPMNFHKQAELIPSTLDIFTKTLELSTTTEASNIEIVGINPEIIGFLKPPMPTPAGLAGLSRQFENIFDVLQEFVKDPSDQNSTVVIGSKDQTVQNTIAVTDSQDKIGQNSTIVSKDQNGMIATVVIESEDRYKQNSTILIDPKDETGQNKTVEIDSHDQIEHNSTSAIVSKDRNGMVSTVVIDSEDLYNQNSTVVNGSKDQTGLNTIVETYPHYQIGQNSTTTSDPNDQNDMIAIVKNDSEDLYDQNSTIVIDSEHLYGQKSTIVIDSNDQTRQNTTVETDSHDQIGQNSTTTIVSRDLNSTIATVANDSEDLYEQNSTVAIDSKNQTGQNTTVATDSQDQIGQDLTTTIISNDKTGLISANLETKYQNSQNSSNTNDSHEQDGQNSTLINGSQDQIGHNSTVVNESLDETSQNSIITIASLDKSGQNSTVTIDSVDQNKVNSTIETSNEMLQPFEERSLFVVDNVTNSDAHKQNNTNVTQNVQHNNTTEEDSVFPEMTLEQWLNMAGELQQMINNETTVPTVVTDQVKVNETFPMKGASLDETNVLTTDIYSTEELTGAQPSLSLRTTLDDSAKDLNNSSAVFFNRIDGNVYNLPAAQNISDNFTAIGQITTTTVSPELSDELLRKLVSGEELTNPSENDNNAKMIVDEKNVVSPTIVISESKYIHGGEYFASPYPDESEVFGKEAVTTASIIPNHIILPTSGALEINSIENVTTNGTVMDYSPVVAENLIHFHDIGSMETSTASTFGPGIILPIDTVPEDPSDKSGNSTLITVSPKDTIPIDGMHMITVSLPVRNDTIETCIGSTESTMSLSFHLPGLTADVLDGIDLNHLSTHTFEPTTQNETVLYPINHIHGEMYPNLDEIKSQFIVDAEQIPLESQTDVSHYPPSILHQNSTANTTSLSLITGTSVIEQLKQSSLPQPDDLTTIATVSEVIVTSQYINLPTRHPTTNAVDASGIIHVFTSTPKPETLIFGDRSPILRSIQLAKPSQNNTDGNQGTTGNFLTNVADPEKIYYSLRSDLVEHSTESEDVNVDSVAHPLENFMMPIIFTSNETKSTIYVSTPSSQLTVIPLQRFDTTTSAYETTTLTPDSEVPSSEQEIPTESSEINRHNSTLTILDNFSNQKVEKTIISNLDTVNDYKFRQTLQANRESVLTGSDNLPAKLYPALPEDVITTNDPQSTTDNVQTMLVATKPNNYSINNLTPEILTYGMEITNITLPIVTVEQNSAIVTPSVSNSRNNSDVNDQLHVNLERDNILDTSLFLIKGKPFDPKDLFILETDKTSLSLNHSIPTNEQDGPLRIPLMIPNAAYIPPSDNFPGIKTTLPSIVENNPSSISELENILIKNGNLTVSPETASGINKVNYSILPSIKEDSQLSVSNFESTRDLFESSNTPIVFSGHKTNLTTQFVNNLTIPIDLENSDDLETGINRSLEINHIQVDDTNVFSVFNPSTIGIISMNGPIFIPDPTVDYNKAFVHSEIQHDAIPNPVLSSHNPYKDFETPNISSSQVGNHSLVLSNTESVAIETNSYTVTSTEAPHISTDTPNLLLKSMIPEIIIDSTQIETNFSPPVEITPYSYNVNNNFLKVPFNPEATIRFTRIDNFVHDDNSVTPANVASANIESLIDTPHETNGESSRIEQQPFPNDNVNITDSTSISNESKTFSNLYTWTVTDSSVPQTVITSSNGTVVPFLREINAIPANNLTTLRDESTNTENTTDVAITNINVELESPKKTSTVKTYLKTFGDAVATGFHSMTKVFRPAESSKTNTSDELQKLGDIASLENTDSVKFEQETLAGIAAINDSPLAQNVTNTFAINPKITNEAILLPTTIENTNYTSNLKYQKTTITNLATNQENSAMPNIAIPHQSTFRKNIEAASVISTYDQTKGNLTNTSDNVSLTNIPVETNLKEVMISTILKKEQANNLQNDKAISATISNPSYETTPFPVVMIANNPYQTFDQRVTEFLLNHNIITTTTKPDVPQSDDNIAYSLTENIHPNLQSVETPTYIYNDVEILPKSFIPNASNVEATVHPNIVMAPPNILFTEPSLISPKTVVSNSTSMENTSFSTANLAVEPQTILNTSYIAFSENAPIMADQNLPMVETFNPIPPINLEVGEQQIMLDPSFVVPQNLNSYAPATLLVIEPAIILNPNFVEPPSNPPTNSNQPAVESMNPLSAAYLEVVEPQAILKPSHVELPPKTQATVVQNTAVTELDYQTFPTRLADPDSPITTIFNGAIPPPDTPILKGSNPLVSENLPSNLLADSATNNYFDIASNSSAAENSSSILSNSENAYFNNTPVEQFSNFETLATIAFPNLTPMVNTQSYEFSNVSSTLTPTVLNNFETSNLHASGENSNNTNMIQLESYENTDNVNYTEITTDFFNMFTG